METTDNTNSNAQEINMETVQLTQVDGMMDSHPTTEIKMDILAHLNETTPTTLYALSKASGLSQTALTMALVEAGGKVAVKDGGIVLAPVAQETIRTTKPRGQMARVVGRLEVAREALLALVEAGPTTVQGVLAKVGDGAKYGDILWVARQEMDKGTIVEVKYGRTNVWTRVG